MRFDLTRYWYRPSLHLITILLLPFSWLFGGIVATRRWLYQQNILKAKRFAVPVIVVGNITVGGTGKTPFVIWLANFLHELGCRPGIVSRGMGGVKLVKPHVVQSNDSAALVGDEALLLLKKTGCPVVVGVHRALAVQTLIAHHTCDFIISDDGLQHYRMARDVEIMLVDGLRRFGNQRLLPAGPLREPVKRSQQVDVMVVNGGNANDAFTVLFEPDLLVSLKNNLHTQTLSDLRGKTVHAVAGIGHPERFFLMLKQAGVNIIPHVFSDHHAFHAKDLAFADTLPVVMTEKDAVKCEAFADERCWYVGIRAQVSESLRQELLKIFTAPVG